MTGRGRSGRGCGRPGRCRRITSVPASFSECLLVAFDPERHTGAVSNGELQGWHADPFGLHEIRYFSAGRPTKLVRDGRVEAYDEPPAEEYTSAAVAVGAPAGGDPDATSDGPSIQSAPGSFAPRKRRGLEYTLVAAVAVGVVVALVATLGGSSGSPGIASAAFVTAAAQRTLAQSTADVTLSGTVQARGRTLSLGGQGQVDFFTNDMSLNVSASSSGVALTENEVLADGNIYLQLVVDGHNLAAAIGGRHLAPDTVRAVRIASRHEWLPVLVAVTTQTEGCPRDLTRDEDCRREDLQWLPRDAYQAGGACWDPGRVGQVRSLASSERAPRLPDAATRGAADSDRLV